MFTHLITELYINSEAHIIYFCGDLNGRTGNLNDVIDDIDHLPSRTNIHHIVRGHGEAIINFTTDCKLCFLNGHINPENDNFTCRSQQGKSVVDYIITPHDCFDKCSSFHVYTMNELSEKCNIAPFISTNCKVPDYSILHVDFNVTTLPLTLTDPSPQNGQIGNAHQNNVPQGNIYEHRNYRFENTPDLFMTSDSWKTAMNVLINRSISCREQQTEIDNLYDLFCNTLTNEMDMCLIYTDAPRKIRKKLKNSKPYWNDKLYDLWCKMRQSEKFYSKFRGPRHKREFLRREYIYKRNIFDRTLRKTEREYNCQVIDNIEEVCTSNAREFSKLLKMLDPRKCTEIPLKVYNEEG